MAIHKAVFALSGKLKTLDGTFEVDETGAQIGEITPLGQLQAGWQGRPEAGGGLSARGGERQAGLSGEVSPVHPRLQSATWAAAPGDAGVKSTLAPQPGAC